MKQGAAGGWNPMIMTGVRFEESWVSGYDAFPPSTVLVFGRSRCAERGKSGRAGQGPGGHEGRVDRRQSNWVG